MTKPLLIKGKTKKSHKRLSRTPPNYIGRMIKLLNTFIKKLRSRKNLQLYFGASLQAKLVDEVKLFEMFYHLANDLVSDDEDLLENCHCLAEKFAELKVNKRSDKAGICETFHHLADDKDILKNVNNASQPQAEEEFLWMETSCVSLNVDENESEEFFKACQRSAKKITVSKIFEDTQSFGDFRTEPNSENFVRNPSRKTISFDMQDPKPQEKGPQKTDIVSKQLEKKTEKIKIVYKEVGETQENLQIVPKPEENKEKLDTVPNSLEKQTTKLQIDLKALENNLEPLKDPMPQEKKAEKLKIVFTTSERKMENLQIVSKLAENKHENLQTVPKPAENKEELDIVPNSLEKKITKIQIDPKPQEKKTEKRAGKKTGNLQIVPKSAENNPENLQIVPKSAGNKKEKLDVVSNSLKKQTTKLQIVPKAVKNNPDQLIDPKSLEKKAERLKIRSDLQIVSKSAENKPENLQIDPNPMKKTPKITEIVRKPKALVKKTLECPTIPIPFEKETLKKHEIVSKPLEKKPEKVETVLKPKKKEMEEAETVFMQQEKMQGLKDFQFSSAEKKKMGKYNSNIFNPTGKFVDPGKTIGLPKPNKRNIILDGSNVAYAHSRKTCFSSEGLQYCLLYFFRMGHDVKAVVPLFRRNAFQSSNPQLLDKLYVAGMIVFTPCKNIQGQKSSSYDDRFILQLAYEWNAAVVSNDNYRDVMDESPAFKMIVESRVLGYTWCDNIFILPKDPYGRRGPSLDEILHY